MIGNVFKRFKAFGAQNPIKTVKPNQYYYVQIKLVVILIMVYGWLNRRTLRNFFNMLKKTAKILLKVFGK